MHLPPGRHKIRNARYATDMLTYIGQFFDHDIDLTIGTSPAEFADIEIPDGDPDFDPDGFPNSADPKTMPFKRSNYEIIDGVRFRSFGVIQRVLFSGPSTNQQHHGIYRWKRCLRRNAQKIKQAALASRWEIAHLRFGHASLCFA